MVTEKKCSKCGIIKLGADYYKDNGQTDGLSPSCKECKNKQLKEYRKTPKEPLSIGNKVCGKCNLLLDVTNFNKDKSRGDGLGSICRECNKKRGILYKSLNKDKISIYNKSESKKQSRERCVKKILQNNPNYFKDYKRFAYNNNPQRKLSVRCRGQILDALRGKAAKSKRSFELIGCTVPELQQHLESKFLPTMTWENHGKVWHIDHILPCASFDLTDPDQQKLCFHYTNLQPLFITTRIIDGIEYVGNLNKGDNILDIFKREVA